MSLHLGDALEVLRGLPDASVDAVVTDPPAGIGFMGKEWDDPNTFPLRKSEGRRLTGNGKPTNAIGFAASYDGSDYSPRGRAAFIAFLAAVLAECHRVAKPGARLLCWAIPRTSHWTGTAIEDAGWIIEDRITHLFGQGFPKGQSKLKPAAEDWWLARKASKTVPALQIDRCRIAHNEECRMLKAQVNGLHSPMCRQAGRYEDKLELKPAGRWPANAVLDEEAAALLDEQSGERPAGYRSNPSFADASDSTTGWNHGWRGERGFADTGGASRFFYCPKASRSDRGDGNRHPTVKSVALMRWLCRLITPPGGTVLDPFLGSGTTAIAAIQEGFQFVGIERDAEYFEIARRRLAEAEGLFAEEVG